MMLRRIELQLFICILYVSTVSCVQHNSSKNVTLSDTISTTDSIVCCDSIKAKANELTILYNKAINGGIDQKKRFYLAFPETFKEFHELYGYDGEDYYFLYEQSHRHINLFCELDTIIPKEVYYDKLVSLSIGGNWQADAVNHLQHCLHNKIKESSQYIVSTLSNRSDKEIIDFWEFIFAGSHMSLSDSKEMILTLNTDDERVMYIANKAIKKSQNGKVNNR